MTFHISPTLNTEDRCNLVSLLFANGGRQVLLGAAKVIITDTNTFPGWETVKPDVIVVTPEWLNRSLKLNSIQPPSGFSPDPRMIFSGVVASSADLPQGDKEIMRQTIVAFGGQWREALTKDVTHVFALATKSERYEKAMALRAQTGMTILLPHWFDDMYNARRSIPTKVYEFPNPDLFSSKVGISSLALEARLRETGNGTFFRTLVASDKALDDPIDASVDVWDNKVVYLSKSLELHDGRRAAVESLLRTGGAKVLQISVSQDSDEMAAARSCDVFVTRYRDGPAFGYALKKGKIIGTLAWVLYVAHGGKLSSPLDRLLHFPIPPWPAPGFSEERLTITNYSGSVRDYLRKLIELLGGHYTPTMSAQNTQVVAASADGKKSDKARQWGIGVVNHTWLEDCFLQWKKVSPGASKYTHQAHGVDWSMNVGECGIGPYRFKSWEEEQTKRTPYDHQTAATTWAETIQTIEAALALGDVQSTPPADSYHPGQQSPGDSERFGGTNTSVRDAMEAITKPKRETASRRTNVFYMATLVTLTKEQTSALLMLGAKLTTRPELVTHLVTSRISKTLKFLACINFSPCIVTDEWVKASIEEKQLAPYLLKDPNGEQQFNMTLEGALRRSKQHKGTLLKGYTFFVTPNGATDLGLTRDVVRAAGGEVKDGFPTARSKTSKTIVLSQESDKESWKKYPGLKIYSGELIYQALLCQKKLDEDAHVLREASG
ncbi:BRCT domain-containing protein [Auriculariales sp. MPI-PUGE-AT-0066]|nr:BRCT domain-containing protein [Auriculariales sp. MPI-PUGE-AT-0066]